MRTYFTLIAYDVDAGQWFDEFGDYSLSDVKAEMKEHSAKAKHKVIVKTDGSAAELVAHLDRLNA